MKTETLPDKDYNLLRYSIKVILKKHSAIVKIYVLIFGSSVAGFSFALLININRFEKITYCTLLTLYNGYGYRFRGLLQRRKAVLQNNGIQGRRVLIIFVLYEDLGTGSAFGFSVGKLTNSFRLELEATKEHYEYDARVTTAGLKSLKSKNSNRGLFINGFYDFQPFTMSNTAITPYLGGGVGISRNKMGTNWNLIGLPNGTTFNGNTINQFAYKLSAGTLVSLTEQLSLDVNYQGAFKWVLNIFFNGVLAVLTYQRGINGGEIKTQELMVGLQYKF